MDTFLWFVWLLVILSIVSHWLLSIGAIRMEIHAAIPKFKALMDKALGPIYSQIRKVVLPVNGLDLTPMIALFLVYVVYGLLSLVV